MSYACGPMIRCSSRLNLQGEADKAKTLADQFEHAAICAAGLAFDGLLLATPVMYPGTLWNAGALHCLRY